MPVISSRVAVAVGVAALLTATASCNSKDTPTTGGAAASPTRSSLQGSPHPSTSPTSSGGTGTSCPDVPTPDGVTVKDRSRNDLNGVNCLQYTINLTTPTPKAAYDSALAKAKTTGYEIEDAGKEPFAWTFEAHDPNGDLPYSIITYVFNDDHSATILAELHH
ncbi:hypothetical protein [Actinomadura opuntiae]|uniref:hypothetical protein n=1 Tax=Actinomadura sp. OS1-43 TaxID=604315 RepID=UPI00255A85F7|nr:hypothetical protein [Actinomadura sp. OS1-43]MDL4814431.1 hypothetical protein [Actinomadura sp. OS1-43]